MVTHRLSLQYRSYNHRRDLRCSGDSKLKFGRSYVFSLTRRQHHWLGADFPKSHDTDLLELGGTSCGAEDEGVIEGIVQSLIITR